MGKQHRFQVTVPKEIYDWIIKTAEEQGRKGTNLASFLLIRATEQEINKTAIAKNQKDAA